MKNTELSLPMCGRTWKKETQMEEWFQKRGDFGLTIAGDGDNSTKNNGCALKYLIFALRDLASCKVGTFPCR